MKSEVEASMYVDGKRIRSDEWVTVHNPAALSEVVGRFPQAGEHYKYTIKGVGSVEVGIAP